MGDNLFVFVSVRSQCSLKKTQLAERPWAQTNKCAPKEKKRKKLRLSDRVSEWQQTHLEGSILFQSPAYENKNIFLTGISTAEQSRASGHTEVILLVILLLKYNNELFKNKILIHPELRRFIGRNVGTYPTRKSGFFSVLILKIYLICLEQYLSVTATRNEKKVNLLFLSW